MSKPGESRHARRTSPSQRFSPYKTVIRPPPTLEAVNIVDDVHTSANLPPYKSPAEDLLPRAQVCDVATPLPLP